MFKSFVFKRGDNWSVLILPYGHVEEGFETHEKATRWSNYANQLLDILRSHYGGK